MSQPRLSACRVRRLGRGNRPSAEWELRFRVGHADPRHRRAPPQSRSRAILAASCRRGADGGRRDRGSDLRRPALRRVFHGGAEVLPRRILLHSAFAVAVEWVVPLCTRRARPVFLSAGAARLRARLARRQCPCRVSDRTGRGRTCNRACCIACVSPRRENRALRSGAGRCCRFCRCVTRCGLRRFHAQRAVRVSALPDKCVDRRRGVSSTNNSETGDLSRRLRSPRLRSNAVCRARDRLLVCGLGMLRAPKSASRRS